jgi:beta-glucosidase
MATENRTDEDADLRLRLAQLTTLEKIAFVSGDMTFYHGASKMMSPKGYASNPWVAARNSRIGFSGVKFVDGPRGIVMRGATTFPVSAAPMCDV